MQYNVPYDDAKQQAAALFSLDLDAPAYGPFEMIYSTSYLANELLSYWILASVLPCV